MFRDESSQQIMANDHGLMNINNMQAAPMQLGQADPGHMVRAPLDLNMDSRPNLESLKDNEVQLVMTNMWSKMKTLESKYMDLANFYKQELLKQNQPMARVNTDPST